MRGFFLLLCGLGLVQTLIAQPVFITDDFADGNFTATLAWSGNSTVLPNGGFIVNAAHELQTSPGTGGTGVRWAYLSTGFNLNLNAQAVEWNFDVRLGFTTPAPPDETNHARIFLTSNNADVNGLVNGYFIRVQDRVSLWRQTGSEIQEVPLVGGINTPLNSPVNVKIRVIRLVTGRWYLLVSSLPQGAVFQGSGTDATFAQATHFGVHYRYSAGARSNQFFFDNVSVQTYQRQPPRLNRLTGANSQTLLLGFSEVLDTLTNRLDYNLLAGENPIKAALNPNDSSVLIQFDRRFVLGRTYPLNVQRVKDFMGNVMVSLDASFIFRDQVAPWIDQIELQNANTIDIRWSENVLPESVGINATAYTLSGATGLPTVAGAVRDVRDSTRVRLLFTGPLPDNQILTLTVANRGITGTRDFSNNLVRLARFSFQRDTRRPTILAASIVPPNQVSLLFSEALDPVTSQLINNFQLTGDNLVGVLPQKAELVAANRVLLTFTQNFKQNVPYTLRVTQVQDLSRNIMTTRTLGLIYDEDPPRLVNVRVWNWPRPKRQIELLFSEPMRIDTTTLRRNAYLVTQLGDTLRPNRARICATDNKIFYLDFPSALPEAEVTLHLQNLRDAAGNLMPVTQRAISLISPQILAVQVRNPNLVWVVCSKKISPLSRLTPNDFLISGIGSPDSVYFATNNGVDSVTLALSYKNSLQNEANYLLTVRQLRDQLGNLANNIQFPFAYRTRVSAVFAEGNNLVDVVFTDSIALSQIQGTFQLNGVPPVAVVLVTDEPAVRNRKFRLLFATNFPIGQPQKLQLGGYDLACEDYLPQSFHEFSFDNMPPKVLAVKVLSNTRIVVVFNKALFRVTAEALNTYLISGIGQPIEAELADNQREVSLRLPQRLGNGLYALTVRNLRDASQRNTLLSQIFDFARPAQPKPGELRVNEILADPSPRVKLPEAEFIEIVNASTNSFNLLGLRFADETSQSLLGEYTLGAGGHLVLCPLAAVDSFKRFTNNVLGLSPWPSLSNSGETIRLLDMDSLLIDRVAYSSNWYTNAVKKNGGWSLELIDPASACQGASNWAASLDTLGGSPGRRNSVFGKNPDKTPPRLVEVQALDNRTLMVKLSENLDSLSLVNRSVYLAEGAAIASVTYQTDSEVRLRFANELDSAKLYQLVLNGLRDCAGNVGRDTLPFGLGLRAVPSDLVISEIMANEMLPADDSINRRNPRRLPAAEYIEIQNRSAKLLNLGSLQLLDGTGSARLPARLLRPGEILALTNTTRVGLFRNVNILGITGFPSLSNSGEMLILADTSGRRLFSVNYSDTWYKDNRKRLGGWALEMIDPSNFCATENNWRASLDSAGGTPGQINSVNGRIQDSEPPRVSVWTLRNNRQIEVTFSEDIDSVQLKNGNNYRLNNGAVVAVISLVNQRQVLLQLAQPLANTLTYLLQITGLRDCANNLLIPFSVSFGTGRLPKPRELVITEIMANDQPTANSPARSPALPAGEYVEIFNPTNDLLTISGVQLLDGTSAVNLPNTFIGPGQYLVLCAASRVDSFARVRPEPRVVGVPGFPSLSNTGERLGIAIGSSGQVIFSVDYADQWYQNDAKRMGGWSLEMIDPANFCGEADNWSASTDNSGGTPGRQNSLFRANPDTIAPKLNSVRLAVENNVPSLLISFSEKMDSLSLVQNANYRFFPLLSVSKVTWIDNRTVRLMFSNPISADSLYQLTIVQVVDCSGNPIRGDNTASFGAGAEPGTHELLITEIMADPTPAVGLPEREYVEIVNPTARLLNLGNVRLVDDGNDAQGGVRLPAGVLKPGEYAILCATTAVNEFALRFPTRRIIGLVGFPALANSGETLTLRNGPTYLFSITYTDIWYGDSPKRNGGWSLEMIDPANPCGEANNWAASVAVLGGTPGAANSVARPNPDRTAPEVLLLNVVNASQVRVLFSEKLDSISAIRRENYNVNNNLTIRSVRLFNQREILLELAEPMAAQAQYTLAIRNIRDCAGNEMATQSLAFGLGVMPHKHELLLTEIMADPSPVVGLPESEYLEIYNPTDKVISTGNVWLWIGSSTQPRALRLPSTTLLPREYALLCPNSAVPAFQQGASRAKIIGMSSWAGLPNAGERLELRNANGVLIFDVAYSNRWYKDQEKSEGGWSLEMRDLTNPCAGGENWEASQDRSGGTPARRNSLTGTVSDNRPPVLRRVDVVDSLTIRLMFDEKLDSLSVITANYDVSGGMVVRTLQFVPRLPDQVVLRLAQALRPRITYTIVARLVRDCAGNTLFTSAARQLVLPERGQPGDLVINEVLFNPPVGGVDFVELYNRSDKFIDLKNWRMGNADTAQTRPITTDTYIMPPRSYTVVAANLAQLRIQYSQLVDSLVIQASLPSYNDDAGTVILWNDRRQLVDRFDYDEKMHFQLLDDEEGVSLERISFVAPSNDRNNWHSAAAPHYGTPTRPNSQAIGPDGTRNFTERGCFRLENEIFTPDGDGWQDFLLIHYDCAGQGVVASIRIFDAQGRPIRKLLNQQTIAQGAFINWDGLGDNGEKARVGYYLLQIEVFDLNGQVQRLQMKAVVGAKF